MPSHSDSSELVVVVVRKLRETDKAIMVCDPGYNISHAYTTPGGGSPVWLPMSLVAYSGQLADGNFELEIPKWLAEKNELNIAD